MFPGLTEALNRFSESIREHLPAVVDYVRRYVEATEKQADALSTIANIGIKNQSERVNL